jgi:Holliday junction resolvase RusA-like endonuclease
VVCFEWHEKTKRRDADNIASAKKFILDALVKNGVLVDDSRKYVVGFHDAIIDDTEDFVRVELIEV